MASLIDIYSRWTTTNPLTYRVYAALLEASLAIKAEPVNTPNHARRATLANRLLGAPFQTDREVLGAAYARVLQQPGLLDGGDDATDADIRAAVAAVLDDVANASG